ncbi:GAF and ANTAR domain-containing protein [Arthrobacter agilis]|uniref:GAF and ANTAR domain-containing protein n=1 Tax=Arthrobacter agilis TaxID=37921 RepID=UPI002785C873|nr:GAF and ANTAR domain-containing protein [Arthrobacter agilis]MDQ0734490.1 hypothetical protein [Arthrobacter agilis]
MNDHSPSFALRNSPAAPAHSGSEDPVPGSPAHTAIFLQNLVLDSRDVTQFLDDLAQVAAGYLSTPERVVLCGVTLIRPRHAETLASSSPAALALDRIQHSFGDGPCLAATRTQQIVQVRDTRADGRWPEYHAAVARQGMLSILGVPIPLEGEANCGLNLYSDIVDGFTPEAVRAAEVFAREASKSLRLAVRIAHLSEKADHLTSALESRTTTDLAAGIVMGQNKCSQTAAIVILKSAAGRRQVRLRDVAAEVVASVTDDVPVTHFD